MLTNASAWMTPRNVYNEAMGEAGLESGFGQLLFRCLLDSMRYPGEMMALSFEFRAEVELEIAMWKSPTQAGV